MNDQRYYFQSKFVLNFFTSCREVVSKKGPLLLIEEVIKVFGRLLQADLFFLSSIEQRNDSGETGYVVNPLADLCFSKSSEGDGYLSTDRLDRFDLEDLRHYENRYEKIPAILTNKNVKRYLVSDNLTLFLIKYGGIDPEQRSREYCLCFGWSDVFESQSAFEGQLYTTELFALISELGTYAINNILLGMQYVNEVSTTKGTPGSLETVLSAHKKTRHFLDERTREKKSYDISTWAIMDAVNHEGPQAIENLITFVRDNREDEDIVNMTAVLRGWEWLDWLTENDDSENNQREMKELKILLKKRNKEKDSKQALIDRLKKKICDQYTNVMNL